MTQTTAQTECLRIARKHWPKAELHRDRTRPGYLVAVIEKDPETGYGYYLETAFHDDNKTLAWEQLLARLKERYP